MARHAAPLVIVVSQTVLLVSDIFEYFSVRCGEFNKYNNNKKGAIAGDCISNNCVQTVATPATFVCCDTPCTGQCDSCTSGTCTPCSTGASTGCATTFNSRMCSAVACSGKVSGWAGNTCQRFAADTPAKCASTNMCVTTDYTYCTSSTTGTAGVCIDTNCKKACPVGQVSTSYDDPTEVCHVDGMTQGGCTASQRCFTGGFSSFLIFSELINIIFKRSMQNDEWCNVR